MDAVTTIGKRTLPRIQEVRPRIAGHKKDSDT
jgi:hypothetical protein